MCCVVLLIGNIFTESGIAYEGHFCINVTIHAERGRNGELSTTAYLTTLG